MKVLITGVAGLLGSRLADWIIENKPEIEVVGIDDLSGGYLENVNPKVKFWQMNLVEHPIENCFAASTLDFLTLIMFLISEVRSKNNFSASTNNWSWDGILPDSGTT